jgi:hypothetical protein
MTYHALSFISLLALVSVSAGCSDHQTSNAAAATPTHVVPELQRPSESEAIEAAVAYLNPEGALTIQESQFLAWGTFNEQRTYWPIKFRMTYKSQGSDAQRHNEYAMKISKDLDGKWKAETYYAWRTDFK